MIRRFILEDAAAQGGKMDVFIISSDRDEMLARVDQLARGVWRGRIVYYDAHGKGGVDILINPSGNAEQPHEIAVSRSTSWGASHLATGAVLAEEVRIAFATFALRSGSRTDDEPEIKPVRIAAAAVPKAPALGQLRFF